MAMVGMKGLQGGRMLCSAAGATSAVRNKHTLTAEGPQLQQKQLHQVASNPVTPAATFIPLPPNVEEHQASEKARFSPCRTRDISSKLNQVGGVFSSGFMGSQGSQSSSFNSTSSPSDVRADVYDAKNTVSLSSVMQSNVPKPFEMSGKAPVHLNMPGGQWAQDEKYLSGELHTCHHSSITSKKNHSGILHGTLTRDVSRGVGLLWPSVTGFGAAGTKGIRTLWCGSDSGGGGGDGRLVGLNTPYWLPSPNPVCCLLSNTLVVRRDRCLCCSGCSRLIHTCSVHLKEKAPPSLEQLTPRQKLQRAVKEYGATVIVFHITISLASLGICYLLVSSGVDMTGLFKALGINMAKFGEGAGGSEVSVEPALETQDLEAGYAAHSHLASDKTQIEKSGSEEITEVDINTKRAAGAATFVVAYAVHKVLAPARIAVTLTATPFIVRYLRKIGFLKPPKPKGI